MTIEAKVIAHSISRANKEIMTMQLKYPRFIHSEFMTHRVFSRNASSSRAIPISRMIKAIEDDTAMPIHWGKNEPGMQAHEESKSCVTLDFEDPFKVTNEEAWLYARDSAIEYAQAFGDAGYHKQIVNRLLEPFMHIEVIVTSTEWSNFYGLRNHPDAQPEIKMLASVMYDAHKASTPRQLDYCQVHLPYITNLEEQFTPVNELVKMSVARCCRVSFLNHDGSEPDKKKDFELYDRLVVAKPVHASPTEHVARALIDPTDRSGNFIGWHQHRQDVPFNVIENYEGLM